VRSCFNICNSMLASGKENAGKCVSAEHTGKENAWSCRSAEHAAAECPQQQGSQSGLGAKHCTASLPEPAPPCSRPKRSAALPARYQEPPAGERTARPRAKQRVQSGAQLCPDAADAAEHVQTACRPVRSRLGHHTDSVTCWAGLILRELCTWC
jgi:hypothetical protein